MEMLDGRYGDGFMSALHSDQANGLAGLQSVLDAKGAGETSAQVVHDWAAMVALDHVIDSGASLKGGDPSRYTTPTLDAEINWANPNAAAATPGRPPNGSDYVAAGRPVAAGRSRRHGRVDLVQGSDDARPRSGRVGRRRDTAVDERRSAGRLGRPRLG